MNCLTAEKESLWMSPQGACHVAGYHHSVASMAMKEVKSGAVSREQTLQGPLQ